VTTVENLIDQDLIETLAGVSTAAGFSNNFIVEEPDPALGNRERDALCVVGDGDPEPQDDRPINQDRYLKTYTLVFKVIESESSDDAALRGRMAGIYADVVKALTESRASYTRNGQALGTTVGKPTKDLDGGGNSGDIAVPVSVLFATLHGDPSTNPYSQS
jgi:hypothetical protein